MINQVRSISKSGLHLGTHAIRDHKTTERHESHAGAMVIRGERRKSAGSGLSQSFFHVGSLAPSGWSLQQKAVMNDAHFIPEEFG